MKVAVNGVAEDYRTVWFDSSLKLIDQNKLPFAFDVFESSSHLRTADAIRNMTVRGAPAIGAAAGFGMAQGIGAAEDRNDVEKAKQAIEATRPTARNLFYATERVCSESNGDKSEALEVAQRIAEEDVAACKKIAEYGSALIKNGARLLTHCNAGWLACVDWGTALAPVYRAHRNGKELFVFVDETRPRLQGARLTAWELQNEGVAHAVIADNAAAHFMQRGEIDLVIVGADRIAANGDVANKIGTLEKAICAAAFGIPFYVAAPLSTVDMQCSSGNAIPIEERSSDEVLFQSGLGEGRVGSVRIASPGSQARNPAFDVTPAQYISGIITERGIVRPEETRNLSQ